MRRDGEALLDGGSLTGPAPPGADLRELGADDLVSLCPDHQRALWRGVLRVKGTTQDQVRFEVDLTRALEPGTRKHLKTRVRSRRHVDMRDLMRRVSLLEGRPPPG